MSDELHDFIQYELSHITVPQISEESKHALFPLFGQLNNAHAAYTKATLTSCKKPDYSPTYAPPEIKPLIALCSHNTTIQTRIGSRTVKISVSSPEPTDATEYIYNAFLLTHLLSQYATNSQCSSVLTIHFFLTTHTKRLSDQVLNEVNVNTAYTYSCKPTNDICIYRSEEAIKVLAHELMHSLGLDFSHTPSLTKMADDYICKLFPLQTELRTPESYCEAWATIIHSLLIAFHETNNKTNGKRMMQLFVSTMRKEIKFSLFQCAKVLRHNKTTYPRLMTPNHDYKENSSIFAYFFLKTMLLYNINAFIEWCGEHNKTLICFEPTNENTTSFCQLFQRIYRNPRFMTSLDELKHLPKHTSVFVKTTMRMTLFG
jgi:hypothetical protein